jgi:hypothetical protein
MNLERGGKQLSHSVQSCQRFWRDDHFLGLDTLDPLHGRPVKDSLVLLLEDPNELSSLGSTTF